MVEIIFDRKNNRSVAHDGNIEVGECDFIESANSWNIIHTEVNKEYQGQGIARKLVEKVLEYAKKEHKEIMAECSYAKKVIEK